jgi:hypothetical protein
MSNYWEWATALLWRHQSSRRLQLTVALLLLFTRISCFIWRMDGRTDGLFHVLWSEMFRHDTGKDMPKVRQPDWLKDAVIVLRLLQGLIKEGILRKYLWIEWERTLGKPTRRWKDNTTMKLTEKTGGRARNGFIWLSIVSSGQHGNEFWVRVFFTAVIMKCTMFRDATTCSPV